MDILFPRFVGVVEVFVIFFFSSEELIPCLKFLYEVHFENSVPDNIELNWYFA